LGLVRFIGIFREKLGRELHELTRIEPDGLIQKERTADRRRRAGFATAKYANYAKKTEGNRVRWNEPMGNWRWAIAHEGKNSQRCYPLLPTATFWGNGQIWDSKAVGEIRRPTNRDVKGRFSTAKNAKNAKGDFPRFVRVVRVFRGSIAFVPFCFGLVG
jgi:hypothetical protein